MKRGDAGCISVAVTYRLIVASGGDVVKVLSDYYSMRYQKQIFLI